MWMPILHLLQCRYTQPFWNAVTSFLYTVLNTPHEQYTHKIIILNISRGKLISTEACAFVRHALNHFYRTFAMVDTHGATFVWKRIFNNTMMGFRNAVLTWALTLRIFRAIRHYSSREQLVAQSTIEQFPTLVTFDNNYAFAITPNFRTAIDNAAKAVAQ